MWKKNYLLYSGISTLVGSIKLLFISLFFTLVSCSSSTSNILSEKAVDLPTYSDDSEVILSLTKEINQLKEKGKIVPPDKYILRATYQLKLGCSNEALTHYAIEDLKKALKIIGNKKVFRPQKLKAYYLLAKAYTCMGKYAEDYTKAEKYFREAKGYLSDILDSYSRIRIYPKDADPLDCNDSIFCPKLKTKYEVSDFYKWTISPNGHLLALADFSYANKEIEVSLFSLKKESTTSSITLNSRYRPKQISFDNNTSILAVLTSNKLFIINLEDKKTITKRIDNPLVFSISPDGDYIAVLTREEIKYFDLPELTPISEWDFAFPSTVSFDNIKYLDTYKLLVQVTKDYNKKVWIWNVKDKLREASIPGKLLSAYANTYIITNDDEIVKVWQYRNEGNPSLLGRIYTHLPSKAISAYMIGNDKLILLALSPSSSYSRLKPLKLVIVELPSFISKTAFIPRIYTRSRNFLTHYYPKTSELLIGLPYEERYLILNLKPILSPPIAYERIWQLVWEVYPRDFLDVPGIIGKIAEAKVKVRKGNVAKAIEILEDLAKSHTDFLLLQTLGETLFKHSSENLQNLAQYILGRFQALAQISVNSKEKRLAEEGIGKAYLNLANYYIYKGKIEEALDALEEAADRHTPNVDLSYISLINLYLKKLDLENAIKYAENINNPFIKAEVSLDIVNSYLDFDKPDEAEDIAADIPLRNLKDKAYLRIAAYYASNAKFDNAISNALKIKSDRLRLQTLATLEYLALLNEDLSKEDKVDIAYDIASAIFNTTVKESLKSLASEYYQRAKEAAKLSEYQGITAAKQMLKSFITPEKLNDLVAKTLLTKEALYEESLIAKIYRDMKLRQAKKDASLSVKDRKVLLVAISKYKNSRKYPNLDGPDNDIRVLKQVFERNGYELHVLRNYEATAYRIKSTLRRIIRNSDLDSTGLVVYLAGHGKKDVFISYDGEQIPLSELYDLIAQENFKHAMVMIDACRYSPKRGMPQLAELENNYYSSYRHRRYRSFMCIPTIFSSKEGKPAKEIPYKNKYRGVLSLGIQKIISLPKDEITVNELAQLIKNYVKKMYKIDIDYKTCSNKESNWIVFKAY